MSTIEKAMGRIEKSRRPDERDRRDEPRLRDAGRDEAPPTVSHADREPLQIDYRRLRKYGIHPPDAMEPRVRDQYRRIKRPLLAAATGRKGVAVERGNLIMITSSIAGEGKTFTSLNLALSIAQDPDYRVTLVDGDVARAHASKLLGLENYHGLLDLLSDDTLATSDVLVPTSIPTLTVLPAGRPNPLREELLSSDRMERVATGLADSSKRHIILFDSSPLLATPDAITLSEHVGQVIVVVKASSTLRHQVVDAVDQIDPDKSINIILNQALGGAGGDEYGDYYGAYAEDR